MPSNDFFIQVDLLEFSRGARKHLKRDWPKAVVKAFSKLADKAKVGGQLLTRRKFHLHSEYILRGIKSYPVGAAQMSKAAHALKKYGDMNAAVFIRGATSPSKSLEFMAHHEYGEMRTPFKKYIAIPMKGLRQKSYKTSTGRVKKRWKPATLLERYIKSGSSFDGRTTTNQGKRLGPSTGRVPAAPFLIMSRQGDPMIVRRISKSKGGTKGQLEFLYILKHISKIKPTWKFVKEIYTGVYNNYTPIIMTEIGRLPSYR